MAPTPCRVQNQQDGRAERSELRCPYEVDRRFHDEAFGPDGSPRPHYEELIREIDARDLDELEAASAGAVRERGVLRLRGTTRSWSTRSRASIERDEWARSRRASPSACAR